MTAIAQVQPLIKAKNLWKKYGNNVVLERLNISVNTVKKHLAHAFKKRGLHNRRQSIA